LKSLTAAVEISTVTNEEQVCYWNGDESAHWLVHEERHERMLAPFTGGPARDASAGAAGRRAPGDHGPRGHRRGRGGRRRPRLHRRDQRACHGRERLLDHLGADLRKGELYFGRPAALIVLLLVFGTLVAASVPLTIALVCIPVTLCIC
jgi:hypothetical protein